MRTRAKAADSDVIDAGYLASTFDLSEDDVQTLLHTPTPDLVQNLLRCLSAKGQEYEAIKAEKLKVDVELENIVRTTDAKIKAQKATLAKHANEVEELREKLNESEVAREALSTEITQLKSSTTGSSAETAALRQRIETLEASNRDALALVEAKSTEKDTLAIELSEQHSKLIAIRRQVNELEDQNQNLQNAASSQKFREQSLQQEIEQLKRNLEWHSTELQTRNQEHSKFRKERNARVAAIQRELEDSSAAVDTLKQTDSTLRQRLDELQTKADEALTKIAHLEEEAIRKQHDFRTELDNSKRLAELQAQSANTHKERLQEVQRQLDQLKDDAADEIGRLQAEVETERSDKEEAEHKVADLELAVERLEQQANTFSRPATPMRNGNADPSTPLRIGSVAGSPTAAHGSLRKNVGGLTFSQLYAKFSQAQEELENERRRTDKLSVAMDELIDEMESRKPEVEELRLEQERLENEVLDFSRLLDEANETRDASTRNAEKWQGEAQAAVREGEILRQQLRDLSAQLKMLLVELSSRDQGLGEMSADERFELERAARGELDSDSLQAMTNTGRLISERLVIFRDSSELVDRNEQLLRLTRELGDKMEGEEAREKARQSAADAEEVEELRRQVERYRDELQSTATQIDSYVKERDLFRRMLQHRGQLPPDADLQSMFGQSVVPATPVRGGLEPPATPRSREVEDMNKLLKEQQAFFDQFRNESQADRRILKDQVDALGREKSSLQADVARAQSQLSIAANRFETLQSNYTALQNENQQLQKRSQQMAENAIEQDRRIAQIAEDLIEARSSAESLRHENSNAKAERDIFKRSEARLNEDNERLREERTRLNKLVTDLQTMQNERELTDSETRRRLQGRVESLESELTDTKRKLEAELEENKRSTLRREYDEGQSRTRIDDLVKSLGNTREELAAAKTARDQLQARVEELKIDLRAAEEKVTALQPRPTPRAEPQPTDAPINGNEEELPAEQRLAIEISELRRDLEYAKNDLESAKQQVEVYRGISQASEEELASFSATADQYKEETEQLLAQKDAKVKELEQRIEDLSSELNTTNNELSELRSKAEDTDRLIAEQKASYQSELARLRDDADRHTEEKKLYQQDLKAQAEIAQQAQQSYEDELLKHADAAKSLQSTRKEYAELKTEVSTIKAEAEAAKISLERAEESWKEQQERFAIELEEATRRRHDTDEQNKLLHKQMETFSNELATLREGRAASSLPSDSGTNENAAADATGNYQEVIKYLRREKEIVDVQYELSMQEAKRLQQQLNYAESQLEETKQKLADERRQSAEKATSEGSTTRLMQTINELNLYRESSITLRNEAKLAREKLEEKSQEVERLLAEIEPLKARVDQLDADIEGKDGEIKLLQDDRNHWRERTHNIISKYDRVDPAELEELKNQLEAAKAEKESLEAEQGPLKEQVSELQAKLESEATSATQAMNERLERFKGQAKEQDRKRQAQIRDLTSEKDSVTSELEKVKTELLASNTELEQTKIALEEARAAAANAQADHDNEEGQLDEGDRSGQPSGASAELQSQLAATEASTQEHLTRAEALSAEVQQLQNRVQELESEVAELEQKLQTANASTSGETQSSTIDNAETLEKLRQDLATAQQEVEVLRANATTAPPQPTTIDAQPAPGEKSVADQVAEEVARQRSELEAQHELTKKQLEETTQARIERMKENLKKQLRDERQKIGETHSAEIKKIQDEHAAAILKLNEAHQAELARLTQDRNTATAKAEGLTPATAVASPAPGDTKAPELSDAQVKDLIRTNPSAKTIFSANLKIQIEKQTARLNTLIAAKDQEIERLKGQLEKGSADGGANDENSVPRAELERQLEEAKNEREAAVRQAIENAEKKAKVQVSQRDMAQAKLAVVKKAATETPDKPVKAVWEIADKTRPQPKPAASAVVPASSPAAPKVAAPTAAPAAPASAPPQSPVSAQTPEQIEQAKLRARQERFGLPTAPIPAPGSFGRPSAPGVGASTGPNPQAAEFKPAAAETAQARPAAATGLPVARTGIPLPGRGGLPGSQLPRIPQRQPSGTGVAVQGTAATGVPRGGAAASGLPRGGGIGRGGRGGRGGANAGQKRQNDGTDRNDDGKRMRSGGAPEGGAA